MNKRGNSLVALRRYPTGFTSSEEIWSCYLEYDGQNVCPITFQVFFKGPFPFQNAFVLFPRRTSISHEYVRHSIELVCSRLNSLWRCGVKPRWRAGSDYADVLCCLWLLKSIKPRDEQDSHNGRGGLKIVPHPSKWLFNFQIMQLCLP